MPDEPELSDEELLALYRPFPPDIALAVSVCHYEPFGKPGAGLPLGPPTDPPRGMIWVTRRYPGKARTMHTRVDEVNSNAVPPDAVMWCVTGGDRWYAFPTSWPRKLKKKKRKATR